jgi:uncharacterized membrane protein
MNLKKLLTKPLNNQAIPRWIFVVFFIVAFAGFVDATFLTVEHYANKIPPCTTDGCEIVLTSSYATVGTIPVALVGALYYFLILILFLIYFDTKKEFLLRTAFFLTILGFVSSLYFTILQVAVIHSYCQYCLFSALTSTILFCLSVYCICRFRSTA